MNTIKRLNGYFINNISGEPYQTLSDQEFDALHLAFEQSAELKELYFTREKFHHILENNNEVEPTVRQLDKWIEEVEKGKNNVFDTFIKTLKSTKNYVANYVQNNLSNAITEGLNRNGEP